MRNIFIYLNAAKKNIFKEEKFVGSKIDFVKIHACRHNQIHNNVWYNIYLCSTYSVNMKRDMLKKKIFFKTQHIIWLRRKAVC